MSSNDVSSTPLNAMSILCTFSEVLFPHLTTVDNNCFTDLLNIKHLGHYVHSIIASTASPVAQ